MVDMGAIEMKPSDKCSHGKRYDENCYECDVVWYEALVDRLREQHKLAEKKLAEAKAGALENE